MKHSYCSDCGAKVQFSLNPPNFCSSCGISLNSIKNTSVNISESRKIPKENSDESEGEISNFRKPAKLEYEISVSTGNITTIEQLAAAGPLDPRDKIKRKANLGPVDKEAVFSEGIKQCASSRPRDIGEK